MITNRAPRRYARAIFELARETNCLDAVLADFNDLARLAGASPEWAAFVGDYVPGREVRMRILTELLAGRLAPLTWRFLLFVEEKRRLGRLPEIIRAVLELHDEASGRLKVRLAVAREWEPDLVAALRGRVARQTGRIADVSTAVEPALIGGFQYQVQDRLYDYSIAGMLRAINAGTAGQARHA